MRCILATKSNLCSAARLRSYFMQVTISRTFTHRQTGELSSQLVLWLCTH